MKSVVAINDGRFKFIDSIRGIAAILVVFQHSLHDYHLAKLSGGGTLVFNDLFSVVDFGKIGVVVFFAISGFVIPFSLLHEKKKPVLRFLVSRFFRLYPVYWISLFLGVIVLKEMMGEAYSLRMVLLNMTMLQQFFGESNVISVYWTLQIELIFYGLCLILFMFKVLHNPRNLFFISLTMLFLSLLLSLLRYLFVIKFPVALTLALAFMFWGYLWRLNVMNNDRFSRRYAINIIKVFVPLMPIISMLGYSHDMGHNETWYRYTASYYLSVLLVVILTSKFKINTKLTVWLGRISYSVYLFHAIVIYLCYKYLFVKLAFLSDDLNALINFTVIASITLLVSDIFYRIVEKPAIEYGKFVKRQLGCVS